MYLQVVKKLWAYIRENNLQDPSNKRKILCDERLKKIFNVNSIDMFQMNKALTKHIWPLNSDGLFLFLSPAPPLSLYTHALAHKHRKKMGTHCGPTYYSAIFSILSSTSYHHLALAYYIEICVLTQTGST